MDDGFDQDIAAVASIEAIPTILDIVCRTTGMRFAAVARVTQDRWIACSVRDDIAFGLKPGGELDVESTICHEIRQTGQAVIIDHVAEDCAYATHHTPRLYGLQSYISMPIRLADGSFFGTLCAIDPEPHRLNTPEIREMFKMFADVIGFHLSAIDKVIATTASLATERETAALREQFIAVLGHDLRNPLAAIQGGLLLLQRTPLSDKAVTLVGMMQGSVGRMKGLINNVLDFAQGRLGSGLTLDIDVVGRLDATLNLVVDELRTAHPKHSIDAVFEVSRPIRCDAGRVAQLLSNLLANALTYGTADKPVRVHGEVGADSFRLSVSNSGDVIPPDIIERLFQPYERGSGKQSAQGLGLGLYIASEIARAHRGTLTATSDQNETCFEFSMPAPVETLAADLKASA